MRTLLTVVFCTALATASAEAQQPPASAALLPPLTKALPDLSGKEVTILTVDYPPGAVSTPHRHDANTFVYVLEGTIIMQVAGGPETTVGPGQIFYESPTDVHTVGKNASSTKPAKFLVFFVKNAGAPISRPPV